MHELIEQLKGRRIWRVLVAWPSVTFVALQVIEFFVNNYGVDPRLLTATIVAATASLPAGVLWNWRHGEVGRQAVHPGEAGAYAATLVLTAGAVAWFWTSSDAAPRWATGGAAEEGTIAVLPFESSGDGAMQYLGDGIAESLINWLATIPDVRVTAKTASFRLRDQADDLDALARDLDVSHVVLGSVERVADQVVISASLVDLQSRRTLWGERLTRPADEALLVEQSIVSSITDGLRLEVSSAPTLNVGGTADPDAYDAYLRGHFLIQATDETSVTRGLTLLRSAIASDPAFARPYADIADALAQMIYYEMGNPGDLLGEARTAAFTAIALAPELPEAQVALAAVHQYVTFDWSAAESAYESAIALSPRSSVPYHRYTDFLWATLRFEKAEVMAQRALELDPLDSNSMHALGIARLFGGDFEGAAEAFGSWNQFHPESLWSWVKHAVALAEAGQCDLSAQQAARAEQLTGGRPGTLMDAWMAWAYYLCEDSTLYEASKARIEATTGGDWSVDLAAGAYFLAIEGDIDGVIDLVDEIVETNSPYRLFSQIFLVDYVGWAVSDRLPTDERYLEILERLDFPETSFSH
jgi:adenylate cyclase